MLVLATGDENTGQQFRVPAPNRPEGLQVSTVPPSELGIPTDSASARATTSLNTAPTDSDIGNFVAPQGIDFAIVHAPSADWTFTPNTCFFTYNGPTGKRFKFSLVASMKVQFEGGGGTFWMAIDQDVALIGSPAVADFTESVVVQSFTVADASGDIVKTIPTTRLVEPIAGQTFQPVFAFSGVVFLNIIRLEFSFEQVGPGGG